ncbi:very short patch repair endonuclease [uncultured Trichococcus sp.]|uniref:very short patch repair endonuclease n=1 Tax=uncultured Trichococcus sp. TaxID=189665 RepID=UPI0029C60E80|nr:very short patch repair endonuclease [uncultured Trichococcus sp.]
MDKITAEQRSVVMSRIKSKSHLEDTVAHELFKRGLRYRRNNRKLVGTPDISIQKYKVVIFIDSCFWHSCPLHGNRPKNNVEFWNKKLDRNIEKATEVNAYYKEHGWHIMRVWEHDLKEDYEGTIERIETFIREAKN